MGKRAEKKTADPRQLQTSCVTAEAELVVKSSEVDLEGMESYKTVTVISLWTRRFRGQNTPHQYDILVPASPTIKEMLADAYWLTNVDGRPRAKEVCSTTSGDIFILDGNYYLVAAIGFHLLTQAEASHEIYLTDTLDLLAWSTRTLVLERQPGVPIGNQNPDTTTK